ncbi:MAG: hypothetical protein MJZ75_05405 [Paludibacteraceae bacterium]|nr:hypothetical protein [Paludibacteraceae bacterium]
MTKNAPEILQLRLDIEHNISRRMLTPYDFEFLAGAIWERLHENLSPTTLKRLWGYIEGADTARHTTLSLLAQFLGFQDWEAYLADLATRTDIESQEFMGEGIHTADLQVGQQVEVTWLPNRHAVFAYLGDGRFEVIEAEHAKIHVGDTFVCSYFLKGQPMYLDNLVQSASLSSGEGPGEAMSYVAGSKTGLTDVTLLP